MFDGIVQTLTNMKHIPDLKKNLMSLSYLEWSSYSFNSRDKSEVLNISNGVMIVVGAKFRLRRRSWSRGSRGRRRDLQGKSKSEVGLLRQDPPMLKSVLCLNKNGALE